MDGRRSGVGEWSGEGGEGRKAVGTPAHHRCHCVMDRKFFFFFEQTELMDASTRPVSQATSEKCKNDS